MARAFTSISQIEGFLNKAIETAVKNSCERLSKKLKEFISTEYYDQYNPKEYIRTYQFLNSATTEMLTKNSGRIYMDKDAMDYKEWTGELQIHYGSLGYHGSLGIRTDGRFWDSFAEFCEKNVRQIFKEELIKQGIPIIN